MRHALQSATDSSTSYLALECPMTQARLSDRLSALPLGSVELMSFEGFCSTFGNGVDRAKLDAARVAEEAGCRVSFIGNGSLFAVFSKRQARADVRSSMERPRH